MEESHIVFQECVEILICLIICSTNNSNNINKCVITIINPLVSIYYIIATSCTTVPASNLLQKNGGTSWTPYSFSHTAATTAPTLVFGFQNGMGDVNYLDDVSVVDSGAPLIQLLNNPSFENSTSQPTGWITWCQSGCGSGDAGKVISGGSCYSGNCYKDFCQSPVYDYLAQSFPATINHIYTISFRLYQSGGPAGNFYANIDD
jgi:hypothetical protein